MRANIAPVKPADDPNVKGDPFRTLFVARLSYDVESKDLEREFGRFGPIERVCAMDASDDCSDTT